MSECPGYTLEDWLEDALMGVPKDSEDFRQIVAILEPARGDIERYLDDYDEEEHGWRDYRDGLWNCVPKDLTLKVDEILDAE
jgi:hypothetical protein